MVSDSQIQPFAAAITIGESARALNPLIKQKKLQTAAKAPLFQQGLQNLSAFASCNASERDRLLAVAVGAHVKANKSEQRPVWGAIIIIAGGGFRFHFIAAWASGSLEPSAKTSLRSAPDGLGSAVASPGGCYVPYVQSGVRSRTNCSRYHD